MTKNEKDATLRAVKKTSSNMGITAKKYRDKAPNDKSFFVTIYGVNKKFIDIVPNDKQSDIIERYHIPDTIEEGEDNFYTIQINAEFYCVKQNGNFKLYDKVMAYLPNGDWSRMYLDYPSYYYEGGEGGTGTGKWLDDAHTSVAHNDWDNNTSQGKYDSVDGYDNVLTGTSTISQSGYVSNGANTVTGQHNRVNNSSAVNASGRRNTVNGSDSSVITGVDNTITNNAYCSFIGGKSVITGSNGTRYSVVLGDEITISNYADNSFVNGSDETFLSSVFQSIIVGDVNGGYSSGNYLPAGEIGCSIVVSDSAIISQLYCSIISGLNNKAYSRVSNSLITGAGNTGIGVYAGIICGSENTVGNGGNSPSSDIIGGSNNIVQSDNCGVVGHGNYVSSPDCIVCGCYGETSGSNAYYLVVGGGLSASDRSNIFTVAPNGNVQAAGTITPGGADYAETYEWLDGNPENEDRRGMLVTLDGKYIKPAVSDDDYILGVVSATPSVCGDTYDLHWKGKYQKDIFGELLKDNDGNPILSPEYNPNLEYIPQSSRKEKAKIGTQGKLVVVDDGTCVVNKYCKPSVGGIGTYTDDKNYYRVIERLDDTHIKIVMK